MAADQEQVLKLFDYYWFEFEIFTIKPPLSIPDSNPILQIHEEPEKPKLSRIQTLHVRSLSDQYCLSSHDSFSSGSLSPNSVLTLKLQTIHSGKEVEEFFNPVAKQEEIEVPIKKISVNDRRRRRRRKKGVSKSLSELEFEELKGFMDLGFVFSEEDKDSNLVSIIPGLQRLGRKVDHSGGGGGGGGDEEEEETGRAIDESAVSRPYLSEAWDEMDDLDQRKLEKPLMNWVIPDLRNEMDMKDHLRFWAHTVASTLR
ncbi:uncharacterized protein LOC132314820 [Cornus florida]|uniref:uncharacterized protein LOC132314820 n=1 Tax=Cornus florida TaxID=4283 RepID=UPI00289D1331|nr:uncharacterized protein LOC132314820 [Cornus florida]